MKRIKVSNNVIRRMPRYLRKLDDLNAAGIERISSGELGRQMGLTPSQIRQDFSCFGEFGQQGYGYNVVALRGEVAKILGMDRNYSAVLVGVGNIGRALVENFCFEQYGFTLKAAFDINPELIGKEMHGIVVHDFSTLDDILADIQPDVAVLCVPKAMANDVANDICSVGVKAIWNCRSRTPIRSLKTSTSRTACWPSATTLPKARTRPRPAPQRTRRPDSPQRRSAP